MINQISSVMVDLCQVQEELPLLIAVSGGPDSLFLLDTLQQLSYPIIIAHFDHQLRPGSSEEAELVGEICNRLGIHFHLGSGNVHAYAIENGLSVEAAGRRLRYQFLFEQAALLGAQAVVTGHTADDQVETILLHLLRGTGLFGLRGMSFRSLPNPWSKTIPLLRPLLGTWRFQIDEFPRALDQAPFQDPSNFDTRFTRNRLRQEVLPVIERSSPGFARRLWQMNQDLRGDFETLDGVVTSAIQACLLEKTAQRLALHLPSLLSLSSSLQRQIFRRAYQHFKPDLDDLDTPALERASRFLISPPGSKQMDWLGGLRMKLEGDIIWITKWLTALPGETLDQYPQINTTEPMVLTIPGETFLDNRWKFTADYSRGEVGQDSEFKYLTDPFQAWIDPETVREALQIRRRVPGDRIKPFGMGGNSIKVSDLMINKKIPAIARQAWPIVVSGNSIVWVPGVRFAEPFRVSAGKDLSIVIKLIRVN